jgi:hypothetical protein
METLCAVMLVMVCGAGIATICSVRSLSDAVEMLRGRVKALEDIKKATNGDMPSW